MICTNVCRSKKRTNFVRVFSFKFVDLVLSVEIWWRLRPVICYHSQASGWLRILSAPAATLRPWRETKRRWTK